MSGASDMIDLAANFGSADITTSQVTENITANGQTLPLNVTLFDAQTPQTVANFYDYVNSGRYNNSIFNRLVTSPDILQGGGASFSGTNPNGALTTVPAFPAVANEFGISNTTGTLAMARPGGSNLNTATNQFFFNLGNNTSGVNDLDSQSFAVFGKATGATDQQTLATLATTPVPFPGTTWTRRCRAWTRQTSRSTTTPAPPPTSPNRPPPPTTCSSRASRSTVPTSSRTRWCPTATRAWRPPPSPTAPHRERGWGG